MPRAFSSLPDSEQGDDTTEHNNQDPNEHEERSHDADSNPCFDEIPEDNPEDELEPWVDYITHKADDLLAAKRCTSWILRQSQIYWRQARMIAKHHEDHWTKLVSNWNPAVSTKQKRVQQRRKAKRWEDDLNIFLRPDRYNRDNNDLTSDMTWLTTAEDSSEWDAVESEFISSRLKKTAGKTYDLYHHDYGKPTHNARPNNRYE